MKFLLFHLLCHARLNNLRIGEIAKELLRLLEFLHSTRLRVIRFKVSMIDAIRVGTNASEDEFAISVHAV